MFIMGRQIDERIFFRVTQYVIIGFLRFHKINITAAKLIIQQLLVFIGNIARK